MDLIDQLELPIDEPDIPPLIATHEVMPIFKGCESIKDQTQRNACTNEKVLNYIAKHTKYPQEMVDAEISGTVYVQFVINKNGEVRDVLLQRGIAGGKKLDNEVLRVIGELPDFIPARQKGREVAVIYNIPIRFNLKR